MKLVIDTNILGKLCHPKSKKNRPIASWFAEALRGGKYSFFIPSIADYELRRKLLHLLKKKQVEEASIQRLDQLLGSLDYIDLESRTLRIAARLWAEARSKGLSTAPENSIDGDVLIAAQAKEVGGIVLTENKEHLSRYVEVKGLADLMGTSRTE